MRRVGHDYEATSLRHGEGRSVGSRRQRAPSQPLSSSPKYSVCIRAYRAEFLAEAIASALAQDVDALEVVIVDDSDCHAVVAEFADSRLRYERNERRLGSTENARRALDLARGRYVTLLGDDDIMLPGFLERCGDQLDRDPSLGVAISNGYYEESGRRGPYDRVNGGGRLAGPLAAVLRTPFTFDLSAALIRTNAWHDVRADFPSDRLVPADVPLWVLLAQSEWGFYAIPERLSVKRLHAARVSARTRLVADWSVVLWSWMRFSRPDLERLRRARLAEALMSHAAVDLRAGRIGEARAHLRRALRTSARAWRIRTAVALALTAVPALVPGAMRRFDRWWHR